MESRSVNVDRRGLNPFSGEFLLQPDRVLRLENPGTEHRLGSGGLARTMWQISCVVASTTNSSPTSFLVFRHFQSDQNNEDISCPTKNRFNHLVTASDPLRAVTRGESMGIARSFQSNCRVGQDLQSG